MKLRENYEFQEVFANYSKSLVSFAESLRKVSSSLQSLRQTQLNTKNYRL